MSDGIDLFYENVNDSMPMRFQSWIFTYIRHVYIYIHIDPQD